MKLLIFVAMLIVFISFFFIFFIFDTVIKDQIECLSGLENESCNITDIGVSFVIGLLMISLFILVDIAVIYIVIKTVTSREALAY